MPSGDQSGDTPLSGGRVRLFSPLPSAFATMTWKVLGSPWVMRVNAIFDPSGDQAGSQSMAGFLERSVWSLPSAFMT